MTKPWNAVIAEQTSFSPQENKSSTSKKAWWTSPHAAHPAAPLAEIRQAVTWSARNAPHARCIRLFVQSVVQKHKYRSCLSMTVRSTVAPAMKKCAVLHAHNFINIIKAKSRGVLDFAFPCVRATGIIYLLYTFSSIRDKSTFLPLYSSHHSIDTQECIFLDRSCQRLIIEK